MKAKKKGLYFILNRVTGLVKIGISDDPLDRMKTLELASGVGLELIGWAPEMARYERSLHNAFALQRRIGEWFESSKTLLELADNPSIENIRLVIKSGGADIRAAATPSERAEQRRKRAEEIGAQIRREAAKRQRRDRRKRSDEVLARAQKDAWRTGELEQLLDSGVVVSAARDDDTPEKNRQRIRNLYFAGMFGGPSVREEQLQ